MAVIDSLEIQISADSERASKSIDDLVGKLRDLSGVLSDISGTKYGDSLGGLANALEKLSAVSKTINAANIKDGVSAAISAIASATKDVDVDKIKNLTESLGNLSKSMSTMSKIKPEKLSEAMGWISSGDNGGNYVNLLKFANATEKLGKALSSGDFKGFGDMLANLKALSQTDFTGAAQTLPKFADALSMMMRKARMFGKMDKSVVQFVQSISRLSGKSLWAATRALGTFGDALAGMLKYLKDFGEANENIIEFVNSLAKLVGVMPNLGKEIEQTSESLKNMADQAKNLESAKPSSTGTWLEEIFKSGTSSAKSFGDGLLKAYLGLGLLEKGFKALKAVEGPVKDAIEVASDLTEVQNVVLQAFGPQNFAAVDAWSKNLIENFGITELAAKEAASRYGALGVSMGISQKQAAEMSKVLVERAADIGSLYNKEFSQVAKDMNAVFTGMVAPMRKYGVDMTQASLKEYALSKGMDGNIKNMTQLQKTMLRYSYVLEKTAIAQGDFARTSDTWANQIKILQSYLQILASTVGQVFINMLKPAVTAINNMMNAILGLVERTANAIGKLMGWQIEIAPTMVDVSEEQEEMASGAEDIADGYDKAKKSADNFKRSILSFDEIHALSKPTGKDSDDDSGSGSGAGSDAAAGSNGNVTGADMLLKDYESDIKSWFELGRMISDALRSAMDSIDWDSIYERAANFGKNLASFLNGLITPDLFYSVGKTLANALNTAMTFLYNFGTEFDWNNLGVSIGEGINGFFENWDAVLSAETLNKWVQGVFDSIITALETVDWSKVAQKIIEFITNVDPETYAILFGVWLGGILVRGITTQVPKMLSGVLARTLISIFGLGLSKDASLAAVFAGIGSDIATTLLAGFQALLGSKAAESALAFINPVTKVVSGIGAIIGGVTLAVSNFISMWQNGWNILNAIFMNLGIVLAAVGAVILGAPALVAGIVAGIVAAISTVVIIIHDNWDKISEILDKAVDWVNGVVGKIREFFIRLADKILGICRDIWNGIVTIFGAVKGWVKEHIVDPVIEFVQKVKDKIIEIFTPIVSWVSDHIIEPIVNFVIGFYNRAKQISEGFVIIIKAIMIVVPEFIKTKIIEPIIATIHNAKDVVQAAIEKLRDFIEAIFVRVKGFLLNNIIIPIRDKVHDLVVRVKEFVDNLWADIQSVWDKVSGWFDEHVITPIKNLFGGWADDSSEKSTSLWEKIEEIWGNAWGWFSEKFIEPLKQGFSDAKKFIEDTFGPLFDWLANTAVSAINGMLSLVESGLNGLIGMVNLVLGGFNKVVSWAANITGDTWEGVDLVPEVSFGRVSRYARGGILEDGIFTMNQGEIAGRFNNGQSVVANNEQIQNGIRDAVVDGMMEVYMTTASNADSSSGDLVLIVGDEEIARASMRGQRKLDKRFNPTIAFG